VDRRLRLAAFAAAGRRARARAALGLVALALAGACYRAAPVAGPAAAPPGRRVVVSLTAQGTEDLAAQVGPGVVRVEGIVAGAGPDTIALALVRTEQASGVDQLWQRQTVRVPSRLVASVSERRLDRTRSWLTAAGLVALAALAATLLGEAIGGDRAGPIDSGPS
jgi:hypothetical protein